jgi:hypothetical protein
MTVQRVALALTAINLVLLAGSVTQARSSAAPAIERHPDELAEGRHDGDHRSTSANPAQQRHEADRNELPRGELASNVLPY